MTGVTVAPYNWRTFRVLWVSGMVAAVALLPYLHTLLGAAATKSPVPLYRLALAQLAQSAVLIGVAAGVGLWLAGRLGLGAPLIETWLAKQPVGQRVKAILLPSVGAGILSGAYIIALELGFFRSRLPQAFQSANANPPAWQGFLASFYGGIAEEILLRLFLLSLLAWLLVKVSGSPVGQLASAPFWVANVIAALIFGLGHLPATRALAPLTPLLVVRAVLLNGGPGILFGYLFWKRGLESAMLAHFTTDLLIHVATAV